MLHEESWHWNLIHLLSPFVSMSCGICQYYRTLAGKFEYSGECHVCLQWKSIEPWQTKLQIATAVTFFQNIFLMLTYFWDFCLTQKMYLVNIVVKSKCSPKPKKKKKNQSIVYILSLPKEKFNTSLVELNFSSETFAIHFTQ